MQQSNLVNFEMKHKYYNEIYDELHPQNNKKTRTYDKPKPKFDFTFKDSQLHFSNEKEICFNQKSLSKFKTFDDSDLDIGKKSIQNKISYHLSNNLAPGFSNKSYDEFRKEKLFQSPEIGSPKNYHVDKWYFVRKDDLNVYYERFFLDKEVEKKRKKNAMEKDTIKSTNK